MNDRIGDAYHEAGHTLLFLLRKRPVLKVTLDPPNAETRDIEIKSYNSAFKTLEIAAAGIIAAGIKEKREISINELLTKIRFEGQPGNQPIKKLKKRGEYTPDYLKALVYISRGSQNSKEEIKHLITRIHFRVKNLLLKRWKDIETIASALLEKGELNYDDPVFKKIAEEKLH
jgi:ATP-dependent Zn protease